MKQKASVRDKKKGSSILSCLLLGMTAGFINGFLGTGGGIFLILYGSFFRENENGRDIFARTTFLILLFSLVSSFFYFSKGGVDVRASLPYCIPALFGGAFGAWLLDKLPADVLKRLFSFLVTAGGAFMLCKH